MNEAKSSRREFLSSSALLVAGTALGRETPENRDKSLNSRDVVRRLADER